MQITALVLHEKIEPAIETLLEVVGVFERKDCHLSKWKYTEKNGWKQCLQTKSMRQQQKNVTENSDNTHIFLQE